MLRMTQQEYDDYKLRKERLIHSLGTAKDQKDIVTLAPAKETPPAGLKKKLVISLPGTLPTWNAILAAGVWKRKKIRDEIHKRVLDAVSQSFRIASG